jgi:hypothetical protein
MLQFWLVIDAEIAQLVEQRIRNAWVAGSIPVLGSIVYFEDKINKELLLL